VNRPRGLTACTEYAHSIVRQVLGNCFAQNTAATIVGTNKEYIQRIISRFVSFSFLKLKLNLLCFLLQLRNHLNSDSITPRPLVLRLQFDTNAEAVRAGCNKPIALAVYLALVRSFEAALNAGIVWLGGNPIHSLGHRRKFHHFEIAL